MAPDLNMQTPDGKMLALISLKGKYVLVDFWASWCSLEIPAGSPLLEFQQSRGTPVLINSRLCFVGVGSTKHNHNTETRLGNY